MDMKINKKWVEHYLHIFNTKYVNYIFYNDFLSKQFDLFKESFPNVKYDQIVMLLCCINSFWSTHCKCIKEIADVIYKNKKMFFEQVFTKPNKHIITFVVDSVKMSNQQLGPISLVSKFCCMCNKKEFPISDSNVRSFLLTQNKGKNKFYNNSISKNELWRNYDFFYNVMDSFIRKNNLWDYKYRQLDLAIWTYVDLKKKKSKKTLEIYPRSANTASQ